MKTDLSKIAQDLEQGTITEDKAITLLLGLLRVRFSLPDSERKKYCEAIEKQDAKLITKSKMAYYKLGIETGLIAFPTLFIDYAKGNET